MNTDVIIIICLSSYWSLQQDNELHIDKKVSTIVPSCIRRNITVIGAWTKFV